MIPSRRFFVALLVAVPVCFSSTAAWAAPKLESGEYMMQTKTAFNGQEQVKDQAVKIEVAADGGVTITSAEAQRPPLVGKLTDGKLLITAKDGPANITMTGTLTADNTLSGDLSVEFSGMTLKGTFTIQKKAGK